MLRSIFAGAVALTLAGCAPGGDGQVNMMMANGHMNIEAGGPGDGYDYKLVFLNAKDFTYDLDNSADRRDFVMGAIPESCINPAILDERRIVTSRAMTGREMANYTVFVGCRG